jgi:hypothetical protein
MASYPGRTHTRRGQAIARQELPPCRNEQPQDWCPCDACVRYWDAYDRRHVSPNIPAYGTGE